MPRLSQRFHRLRQLRNRICHRLHLRSIRELNQSTDDGILFTNEVEDEEEMLDRFWFFRYILTKGKRFLFRRSYRKRPFDQFSEDLGHNDKVYNLLSPDSKEGFLNANEFLEKYRMSRENFDELVFLIQNHTVFQQTNARGRKQAPPAHQLMVLLRYLASEGNGATNPNLRNTFKIGRGTSELYKNRCVAAICSLKHQFYFWPNEEERLLISKRIQRKYLFPNCVGMVDGTLNGLAFRPECEHASDYHGRKLPYSISTTIVCDDKRRIRYYLAGWPGSTHDNRVFKNSSMFRNHVEFFYHTQYILGDSAYEPLPFVVSAFKKPQGHQISHEKENFNQALSKPRVLSEHTIGIWKGRFPWLRWMRLKITNDPLSVQKILDYILCTVILHNFLIKRKDKIPDEWIELNDNEDVGLSLPDDDPVNVPINANLPNNYRRQQILYYMNKHYVPT